MDQLNTFFSSLDYFRSRSLRLVLKTQFIREIYKDCAARLGVGYLLTVLFYLPLSFIRPDILLLSGPLIFGYPHLIASFRYVDKRAAFLFSLLTLVCIVIHLTNFEIPIFGKFAFGVWQLILAMAGLVIFNFFSRNFSFTQIFFSLILSNFIIYLAQREAVIFIGLMLILHNWVGYFYWILASNKKSRRSVAIGALTVFFFIHLLVILGYMDQFFPTSHGQIDFPGSTLNTGWYLASWTSETVVWYRLLTLYAFGLSVHYYVWLKAIPQSLNKIEHPNSIQRSFKILREEIGGKLLLIMGIVSVLGILIWLFSFDLGSRVYFELAIMHGALELVFFFPRLIKKFYISS